LVKDNNILYHSPVDLVHILSPELSWHDRQRWDLAIDLLGRLFSQRRDSLWTVIECARAVRDATDRVSPFIQTITSRVCPECPRVCCVNKHGYYDHEDLIYVFSLGLEVPRYGEGLADSVPCQFLGSKGCSLPRTARPFRCNWYFCMPLVRNMEEAPGRAYRAFVRDFEHLLAWRNRMIEEFDGVFEGGRGWSRGPEGR
jgi:hypothetical protein